MKVAGKYDCDTKQINHLEHLGLYLDCQNNGYEVDLLGNHTWQSIPYWSWLKNNTQS